MKKLILAALVAIVSVSANAQYWVGGEVGFSAGKTTVNGNKINSDATFKFLPQVGYQLNDKFDVALTIGMAHYNDDGISDTNMNSFILNPYLRYKFASAGNFTFFVDGGFTYQYTHTSGVKDNLNQWEIGIKPGFSYALNDKVSLVAHVGDLSYQFGKQGDVKTNRFNIGVDGTNLSIGAYVNF